MSLIDREKTTLLLIDFQARLMPAISGAEDAIKNAGRLLEAARLVGVPMAVTEQNPKGLGHTVDALDIASATQVVDKMTFDATQSENFNGVLTAERPDVVVAGCEAHVCVLQTVLGLLDAGQTVFVVADALGSRAPANKAAAIERMRMNGAEIVTTEMVVFEWLASAEHPAFKAAVTLIK